MSFQICGREVPSGEKEFLQIKVASMLDGSDLHIPVHVINGVENGPVVGLFSCIHGTEYYSNRIIRRSLNELSQGKLRGTVIAVPVANPIAFAHGTRQTPEPPEETVDFANLNRVFPGKRLTPLFGSMEISDISLTMKMAVMLTDAVLTKCNLVLDFHGQRIGMALNKMLFNRASERSMELAKIFGLGIIHDPEGGSIGGSLTAMTDYAERIGIPGIAPEIGGAGHSEAFELECEKIGIRGVRNVLIHLGMIDGIPDMPDRQFYFKKAPHVRAGNAGYFVSDMAPEDVGIGRSPREVEEGEILGYIYNPYTLKDVEKIRSPCDGLLYASRISGLVGAQAELLAVADYDGSKWIEN